MHGTKVVIVDDSFFSITVLKDILEENGLEVVGTAGTLEELKDVLAKTKPELVTMDMTLPGTDGMECTREVHKVDKTIKVIMVSSMMDDEIVEESRKNKIAAFLQKPVDAEELMKTIRKVLASDELYQTLQADYLEVFKQAQVDNFKRLTKVELSYKKEFKSEAEHESQGITVVVGIIGKFSGRVLFDFKQETAYSLVEKMLKKEPTDKEEVLAVLREFANIIAGNACSMLNRKNKAYGLRVAPPFGLYGENVFLAVPEFKTMNVIAETEFGELLMNVGFKRGDD